MPSLEQGTHANPLPSAEINLGGTSTNELFFKTASAQNGVAAASTLVCYTPGSNVMKQRPFKVRVGGRVTTGTSATATFSLYWGTTSLSASNIKVASNSAVIATASRNWFIEFTGQWDSTSSQIMGVQSGWVAGSVVSGTVITASTSTVDLSGESTSNGFTVTGTFSSGNASNAAFVDFFEVLTL